MAAQDKIIEIEVREKIATFRSMNFQLVGGNNDYKVVFDFDEDWEGETVKTAVFVFGKGEPVYQLIENGECRGVAISDASICLIGAFAGDIKTTTPALVECVRRSILDEANGAPQPPEEDIYNQIMELLNRYIGQGGGSGGGGQSGFSPTVKVEAIANGHRVTITDVNGDHVFDVMNGAQGAQGEKGEQGAKGDSGADGKDGYTPEKGKDYWNEQDIAEIHRYIDAQVAPIAEEINGVEEEIAKINEGGVE